MRRIVVALTSVLVAGSLTAGGGAEPERTSVLIGPTWQLATLAGLDRHTSGITARFAADGKVSGFSGCNQYSGTYTRSAGSIRVGPRLAVTRMECSGAVMRREQAFLAALAAARTYSIRNDLLTLAGPRGAALATFVVQSKSLAGTRWNVVAYNNGKQAVVSVLASTKLTANFGADGTVGGFAGCNEYSGSVKPDPPRISIGPLATTRKACAEPPGVMEQEGAYLAALGSAATYRLQGTQLELRSAAGAIAVTLVRA